MKSRNILSLPISYVRPGARRWAHEPTLYGRLHIPRRGIGTTARKQLEREITTYTDFVVHHAQEVLKFDQYSKPSPS